MELDWNWYFSATAQSMAAIVGIILGAFIISTLIANNQRISTRFQLFLVLILLFLIFHIMAILMALTGN